MFTKSASADGSARPRSTQLYRRGRSVFPDGVTRATIEKDPDPIYVSSGHGAFVVDVDGNRFLDLNNNFTTLLHGHAFEPVVEAVAMLVRSGSCFANPTEHEIALAELLVSRIPAIERVRFVNTGTEAVMFAIKAARAYTGRPAVARFAGAYHGGYDWGQDALHAPPEPRRGKLPSSARSDNAVIELQFNDSDGVEEALSANAERLAAVIIDPMPSRAGLLEPTDEFIQRLMAAARRHDILIIADEVLNLRQSFHGASARYGLLPDLLTAGKIIGGGFPIGAVGGRAEVMSVFGGGTRTPPLSQGGTFSANPVSMRAGLIAMEAANEACFAELETKGERLRQQLSQIALRWGLPFSVTGAASLFRIHAKQQAPTSFAASLPTAEEHRRLLALTRFFRNQGILLPFGAAACLSTAMTDADVDRIAATFEAFVTGAQYQSKEAHQ